jgi:hypothetical protein
MSQTSRRGIFRPVEALVARLPAAFGAHSDRARRAFSAHREFGQEGGVGRARQIRGRRHRIAVVHERTFEGGALSFAASDEKDAASRDQSFEAGRDRAARHLLARAPVTDRALDAREKSISRRSTRSASARYIGFADPPVAKVTAAFGTLRTRSQTMSAPPTASALSSGIARSFAIIRAEAA